MTEDKARKGKRNKAAEEQANVEVMEGEPAVAAEVKPKRHRRTKAEIEAADAAGEPRRIRKSKAKVEAEPAPAPEVAAEVKPQPIKAKHEDGQWTILADADPIKSLMGMRLQQRADKDQLAKDLEDEISGVYRACDITNKRWEIDLLGAVSSLLAVCPLSAAGIAAARRRLGKEPLVWLKHINQRAIDNNSR